MTYDPSLKFQRFFPTDWKHIGMVKFVFAAKTPFLIESKKICFFF